MLTTYGENLRSIRFGKAKAPAFKASNQTRGFMVKCESSFGEEKEPKGRCAESLCSDKMYLMWH